MPKTIGQSWKRQRIRKAQHIPDQEWVIHKARQFSNLQERSLFILCYLTAGRITEIIPKKWLYKRTYKWVDGYDRQGNPIIRVARNENQTPIIENTAKIELNYKGIYKRDISIGVNKKGKTIMAVRMQNRKNKTLTKKNVPIPVDHELELVMMLWSYLNTLNMDDPLFDFRIGKAEKIISKIDLNPHFIRDIRLTHMVQLYDFNPFELAKFAGWKNAAPAERYVRLSTKDLEAKF